MRKFLVRLLPLFVASFFFSSCGLFTQPQGGIKVSSNEPADVYLGGKNIGTTPLSREPLEVKKYQVKIVPQDPTLLTEETQVKLFPGMETIIDWRFAKTKDESSGWIIEVENSHKRDAAELEVITSPDNVPVTVDGENKGFSPLIVDGLTEGEYQLGLRAPGFTDSQIGVKLTRGKRILVTVKLARKPLEIASASAQFSPPSTPLPTATPRVSTPKPASVLGSTAKSHIQVLETPTGFLRVRSEPSVNGKVLGQLNTGDTAPYLGETSNNWFKISFGATTSAWVSGEYSQITSH